MSDTDSFIDEVTEEVRRDRLFATFKRWAWLGLLLVIVVVGGAAWREFGAAQDRAAAEARGDALTLAVEDGDAGAILEVPAEGDTAAVRALLAGAQGAEPALAALAVDPVADPAYRDLAVLKSVLAEGRETDAADRRSRLSAIAAPGAPYRVLAEEQIALIEAETGETGAAIERMTALLEDTEAGAGLRERARQVIVALGGTVPEPTL